MADDLIERTRLAAKVLRDIGGQTALAATVDEAADALSRAEADARRLDWLAENSCMASGWRDTSEWDIPTLRISSTRECCLPVDLRAAIDAAMGGEVGE